MAKSFLPMSRRKLILLGLSLSVAVFFLYWLQMAPSTPEQKTPGITGRYQLEKTEKGVNVNCIDYANKLHIAIAQSLANLQLTPRDLKENAKEVKRQQENGYIRWNFRQQAVALPNNLSYEEAEKVIAGAIKNAGGEILAQATVLYQGAQALRLELGFRDILNGEPLVITTDHVYLTGGSSAAITSLPKYEGKSKGELAIIIDDFGYAEEPIVAFINLQRPLTFAVLPYHPYSQEAASKAVAAGLQVILHLPLEPLASKEESEANTIAVAMSDEEIRQLTEKELAVIPGIIGVNNHQGSKATADKRVMRIVLASLQKQSLFFIDSRTNSKSVAATVARQLGVATAENELFLDNSSEIAAIKKQLQSAGDLALKYGSATVIGHARLNTAAALREALPELEQRGIRLVFVSRLVK